MAFWSKPEPLLTPSIVAPVSAALASVPHNVEWGRYEDGEEVSFIGENAKIHIWANGRDRHGTASIMRPHINGFELSNNVVLLCTLLDYNDECWEDYRGCYDEQQKLMNLYGLIVGKYATPYFLGSADFELLIAFNRGFCCAYTGHFSGRFS